MVLRIINNKELLRECADSRAMNIPGSLLFVFYVELQYITNIKHTKILVCGIWAQSVASVVQVYPCNNVHTRCRYIVCTFFFESCCTDIRAKDIRVRPLAYGQRYK